MKLKRSSGIILHPTSLPGPYGIGDLGPEAYRWIDFLTDAGCALWQVLPLGPTGYGDSPYQCFSAFAGNPLLISPQMLLSEDLLHPNDLVDMPKFPVDYVDYGAVIDWKSGKISLDKTMKLLELNVKKGIYNLIVLNEEMSILILQLENARKRYEQAEINYNNGLVSEYTKLSAQVAYENRPQAIYQSPLF